MRKPEAGLECKIADTQFLGWDCAGMGKFIKANSG
jgi:hypothetical protein